MPFEHLKKHWKRILPSFLGCSQTTSGLKFLPLLHSKSGSRIFAFNIIHSSCFVVTLRQWRLAVSFLSFCWPWLTLKGCRKKKKAVKQFIHINPTIIIFINSIYQQVAGKLQSQFDTCILLLQLNVISILIKNFSHFGRK